MLDACQPSRTDLVEFALYTGMRLGELLGLTWPDVDRARGVVLLEVTKSGRYGGRCPSTALRMLYWLGGSLEMVSCSAPVAGKPSAQPGRRR